MKLARRRLVGNRAKRLVLQERSKEVHPDLIGLLTLSSWLNCVLLAGRSGHIARWACMLEKWVHRGFGPMTALYRAVGGPVFHWAYINWICTYAGPASIVDNRR